MKQRKRKQRRIQDESGIKMSRQMLVEHQGISPARNTAQRSIHVQHSKTRVGEMQPIGDNGKNKVARMIPNPGRTPASYLQRQTREL